MAVLKPHLVTVVFREGGIKKKHLRKILRCQTSYELNKKIKLSSQTIGQPLPPLFQGTFWTVSLGYGNNDASIVLLRRV